MSNPFLAEIRIFTGNFAPKGWALCDGQLMSISQNTALFSLLGTTYGGNGTSNFALPNLQGCSPMQAGQGPGLSLRDLGETGGEQTVTLLQSEMPSHNHALNATTAAATSSNLNGLMPAVGGWNDGQGHSGGVGVYSATAPTTTVPVGTIVQGSSFPHNNMMPY